jgi:hypothetical protein
VAFFLLNPNSERTEAMKTNLISLSAVAALLVASAAPALADSQLIASAGLTPAEAEGMSLTEIAVAKFNRGSDQDGRQVIVTAGSGGDTAQLAASAGLDPAGARGLSLVEIAVAKFNRGAGHDGRQYTVEGGGVTVASRSVAVGGVSQLAANAGLSAEAARGLSLTDVAVAKFNRDADGDGRQGS